ncbi:MAG TPA: site-2 protease family protein [Aggregatilineaceae bacterium]|nr:site-2 protease family protein [Aggregatilineaceae bacterium]
MESRVRLGQIWGIPIGLHTSWFIIFLLLTFSLAVGYFPQEYEDLSPAVAWLLGGVTSVLFFGSVLAHELAHAWVALRNEIPVRSITLFIFGGVAQIEREPHTPGAEFRIAIAGPIMSLALAGGFFALYQIDQPVATLAAPSIYLARINFLLGLFNMIPGFPLDGGRVLRAIVWKLTGNMRRATRIAGSVGQVVAFGFMSWGALTLLTGSLFNGLWIMFIGWFLQNAAMNVVAQSDIQEALRGVSVGQIMSRECLLIPREQPLRELVESRVLREGERCFMVGDGEHMDGMLTLRDVAAVPQTRWDELTAGEVMVPWSKLTRVSPRTELLDALRAMDRQNVAQLPVVDGDQLVGVLTREQVLRYVHMRSQLGV